MPIWLPLIIGAIVAGVALAWLFPPSSEDGIPPMARFVDVTERAGLSAFAHHVGSHPGESPTTIGGGVVVFDYDQNGAPDLFFVNGTDWPWEESFAKQSGGPGCALFRNDGTGHFVNVSARAGVNIVFQGMAATAGDFDNDGWPDLFITGIGSNHLFRNRGDGHFEDVTEEAGVAGDDNCWSTGATWLDIDDDGRLDLVVCHYARWPHEVGLAGAFSVALMGRSYGVPTGFVSAPPSVYRNVGSGRFEPVANSAGLAGIDEQTGFPIDKAVAVVPADVNGDGRLDLLIAYHTHETVCYLRQANGTFRRWTVGSGDRREAAAADYVSASPLPYAFTAGVDDRAGVLLSMYDLPARTQARDTLPLETRFGAAPLDYDRDGRMDLYSGNGQLEPDVDRFENGRDFSALPRFLWQGASNKWMPAEPAPQSWSEPVVARGVATADFDGDGDSDIVISQFEGPPVLLRNDQRTGTPWLSVDLVATRGAREAGGARISVYTPRRVHVQTYGPVMGFMAQSSRTLFFGLGEDARVNKIEVEWPGGERQAVLRPDINRHWIITQE